MKALIKRGGYGFCKLPQGSKFAHNLGLQHKLQQISARAVQSQKQDVKAHQFIIGIIVCAVGSFFMAELILPEWRNKLKFIKLGFTIEGREDQILKIISDYQENSHKRRIFTDRIGLQMINRCLSSLQKNKTISTYASQIEQTLQTNLLNKKNKTSQYSVYKKYLIQIHKSSSYKPSSNLPTIISNLVQNADLEVIYLIALLINNRKINIDQSDRNLIGKRVKEFQEKVNQRIKILNHNQIIERYDNIEPYEFEQKIKIKWIKFIKAALLV